MPVSVVAELLEDGDAELLANCAEEFLGLGGRDIQREIFARPLGRYGYTNSRLYRVFFEQDRRGLAFVIKTDTPAQMTSEWEGCLRVRTSFPGAADVHRFPVAGPECRALIYRLIAQGGDRSEGSDVVELEDLVYSGSPSAGLPSAARMIERLYDHVARGHKGSIETIQFGDEYKWYLRENSLNPKLLDPLTDLFGADDDATVTLDGLTLGNPRRVLDAVKSLERDCMVTAVHGDLHPNNVLINEDGFPAVIDFAFGNDRGHWIKDFVLMECSLRFLLPPRLLRPDVMTRADELMITEDGTAGVGEMARATGGRTGAILEEMAGLVGVVRRKCRECCPGYEFMDYLIGQYLVLMGSLRLPAYQDLRSLRACCGLADHLSAHL